MHLSQKYIPNIVMINFSLYCIVYEISERYTRFVLHSIIQRYVYEMIAYFQKWLYKNV